jgi:acyl carrier protein
MDIAQEIRQFIRDNFLAPRNKNEIGDDDSFLANGVIDSTGVLELVTFLEETYDIKVRDEDLVPENLDSIRRISVYVEKVRSVTQG